MAISKKCKILFWAVILIFFIITIYFNNKHPENLIIKNIDGMILVGESSKRKPPSLEIQLNFGKRHVLNIPDNATSIHSIYGESSDLFYVLFTDISPTDGDETYTIYKYTFDSKTGSFLYERFLSVGKIEWIPGVKSIVVMNDTDYCAYSMTDEVLQYRRMGRGNELEAINQLYISQFKYNNALLLVIQNLNEAGKCIGTSLFKIEQDDMDFITTEVWSTDNFVATDAIITNDNQIMLLDENQHISNLDLQLLLNP